MHGQYISYAGHPRERHVVLDEVHVDAAIRNFSDDFRILRTLLMGVEDTTIVRGLLMPRLMTLCSRWNWWHTRL